MRKIESAIEEQIMTGMIVSDKFLRNVIPATKMEYFKIGFAQTIAKWCIDYYKAYEEAPAAHIQDLFTANKKELKDEHVELVSAFLEKLSDRYEDYEGKVNDRYLLDKALEYYNDRKLKIMSDRISALLEVGKREEAVKEVVNFRQIEGGARSYVSYTVEHMERALTRDALNENRLFQFPGALGELVGWFERETLVGVLAPMKRGKTFLLLEIAALAMFAGWRVVFASLEMDADTLLLRLGRRINALARKTADYFLYPVFDCKKNQDGSCTSLRRGNKKVMSWLDRDGKMPVWIPDLTYEPCTLCRGTHEYSYEIWYEPIHREKMQKSNVLPLVRAHERMYGDNLRILSFPAYSANLTTIENEVEKMETIDGFYGDLFIFDYAEIFAPENSRMVDERTIIDTTWKRLKGYANKKHACVVTATQTGDKKSLDKKTLGQSDVSGDVRKNAHVDKMIAMNQTADEKRKMAMRINVIDDREDFFDSMRSCVILQQLDVGQVVLDSEIMEV